GRNGFSYFNHDDSCWGFKKFGSAAETGASDAAHRLDDGIQVAVVAEHHELVPQAGEMGIGRDIDDHVETEHLRAGVRGCVGSALQILDVDVHAGKEAGDFVHNTRAVQGNHIDIVGVGTLGFARAGMLDGGGQLQPAG